MRLDLWAKRVIQHSQLRPPLKAEKLGLIDSAHDKTKELRNKGFYVSDQLLDDISKRNIPD